MEILLVISTLHKYDPFQTPLCSKIKINSFYFFFFNNVTYSRSYIYKQRDTLLYDPTRVESFIINKMKQTSRL